MSDKKFFFITICYNNLQGLQRTVDSLRAQHYADWECVIVDGNSRDGTKAYLEELVANCSNFTAVSEPDRGIYDAMNKGIERMPACDYFCFLNSGDALYAPQTLTLLNQQLQACRHERLPAIVYGATAEAFADGQEIIKPPNPKIALVKGMFCHHQSMFFHYRFAHLRYDLSYKLSGDYDYIVRAMQGLNAADLLRVDFTLSRFDMTGVSNSRRIAGIKEDFRLRVSNGLCSTVTSALYAVRSLSLMGLKQVSYPLYLLMRTKTITANNHLM